MMHVIRCSAVTHTGSWSLSGTGKRIVVIQTPLSRLSCRLSDGRILCPFIPLTMQPQIRIRISGRDILLVSAGNSDGAEQWVRTAKGSPKGLSSKPDMAETRPAAATTVRTGGGQEADQMEEQQEQTSAATPPPACTRSSPAPRLGYRLVCNRLHLTLCSKSTPLKTRVCKGQSFTSESHYLCSMKLVYLKRCDHRSNNAVEVVNFAGHTEYLVAYWLFLPISFKAGGVTTDLLL